MISTWLAAAASFLLIPLIGAGIDLAGQVQARRRGAPPNPQGTEPDFEVLVPIYGSIRYLENVIYLSRYGARVTLCTTDSETPEFYVGLREIADRHGFRIFTGTVARRTAAGRRSTAGVVRDRLIRDALAQVRSQYVVCIDADTTTTTPLDVLVGTMAARGLDLASVRLVPANTETLLGKLQGHEYRLAMMLRRVAPWMISGACHAARTAALRDVMNRHSLFFQGNDIEVGLLATARGYTVGHIPIEVPTVVPDTAKAWWRQRFAWAGGEVRLFLANPQLVLRHPFFWAYGALVALAASLLRWDSLLHPVWALAWLAAVYLALTAYLSRAHRDRALLLLPLYAVFSSLVLTPMGVLSYAKMAVTDRNLGLIRAGRGVHTATRPSSTSRA